MNAVITGFGSAFPPAVDQEAVWEGFFATHFTGRRGARYLWRSAEVEQRHAAVDPRSEDLSRASTGTRMARFVEEAVPLGRRAVERCLDAAGLHASDVEVFTTVSCTGYATPGLDILLARELGMPAHVQRLHVGHMGCYASVPALAAASDAAVARGKTAVVLCVELTSLHVQPATDDLEQVVAHALFSDAAVAVAVQPSGAGLELLDVAACTDAASADDMSWTVTDHGFRMRLSPAVPAVLDAQVTPLTETLLARNGLGITDVDHWAIHPGGPRIVTTVARRLGLDDHAVAVSRDVLRRHGNCSSATVLLVLDELIRTRAPAAGEHVVAMAFGPGLTLYAALLRVRAS